MAMTDPTAPTRDANVGILVDQAKAQDAQQDGQTDADDVDRKTMDYDCHACGTPLTPNSGLSAPGRRERSGLCPNCRLDGIGSATFVTVTGYGSPRMAKRLRRRQRAASAQSTHAAAAFLDPTVPLGDYAIRRTHPKTVVITWADDVDMTFEARRSLTRRLVEAGVWYVHSFPDRIRLVDRVFADPADGTVMTATKTIRGP